MSASIPCYTSVVSLSRRHLVLLSSAALVGCDDQAPPARGCATPIDEASKKLRQTLAYVQKSPRDDRRCDNCNKYVANQFQACGGCLLFSGPVAPAGYCQSWVATPLKTAPKPSAAPAEAPRATPTATQ